MLTGYFFLPSVRRVTNGGGYFINRVTRLYPALWACLPITCITYYLWQGRYFDFKTIVTNVAMVSPFAGCDYIDESYWTLPLQLIVYLVFALFYFIAKRKESKFVLMISSWFFCDCLWLIANQFCGLHPGKYLLIVSYLNIFVLGVLLKYLESNKDKYKRYAPYILFLLLYSGHVSLQYMTIVLMAFVGTFVISYWNIKYTKRNLLAFLGRISYPFYLIHQVVGYSIMNLLETNGITTEFIILLPIAANFVIAYLISRFVEKPIMHYCRNLVN